MPYGPLDSHTLTLPGFSAEGTSLKGGTGG